MRNLKIEARAPNTHATRLNELIEINWRLAAEVIRNPNVTAELLASIFVTYESHTLREQVIAHANCPVSLLLREGPRYSAALLRNPVLPLLLLEDPNFYDKLEINRASFELCTKHLPEDFVDWLIKKKDSYQLSCLASNRSLSASQVEALIQANIPKEQLAAHHRAPAWLLEQLAWSRDHNFRMAVAKNPSAPQTLLLEMVQYEAGVNKRLPIAQKPPNSSKLQSMALREALSKNPSTPSSALEILRREDSPSILQSIAQHPNASDDILLSLLDDARCRTLILSRERLSLEVLRVLLQTTSPEEQVALLARGDVAPSSFAAMSSSPEVLLMLASNTRTPPDLLRGLARSDDASIRAQVARNTSAPSDLLARLCADAEPSVRRRAASRKDAPLDLLRLMHTAGAMVTLSGITQPRRPLTDDEKATLHALGPFGAKLAAARVETPADPLLSWLWRGLQRSFSNSSREAELKASWLQAKTESNPRALEAFITHESAFLRARIASNPNLSAAQLKTLSGDDAWFVRLAVALRPDVPLELLRALASDKDVRVRRVVAESKLLPHEMREILLHDKKKKVRRAAASVLPFPHIQKRVTCHLEGTSLLPRSRSAQPQPPPPNPEKT